MADSRLPSASSSIVQSTSGIGISTAAKTIAESIDAFAVYEEAVQTPLIEAHNLDSLYYNAQSFGSRRPYAKLLREDFSSTGAVATTWLTMDAEHRAQAVDIDLEALKIARRRLLRGEGLRHPLGEKWTAKLLQHSEFTPAGEGSRWAEEDEEAHGTPGQSQTQQNSTWAEGAASDRFERKFQAKQAKLRAKHQQKKDMEKAKEISQDGRLDKADGAQAVAAIDVEQDSPHLLLLHSSVLSLPFSPPSPAPGTSSSSIAPPDIVASLNYALSYFHTRPELLAYLSSVRASLRKGTGVLISDQFAGPTGEAARQALGQGRELSAEEEEREQDEVWRRFTEEEGHKGFLRRGETLDSLPGKLSADIPGVQIWRSTQGNGGAGEDGRKQVHSQDGASATQWPRGRLSLVRKGEVLLQQPLKGSSSNSTTGSASPHKVPFEYWREDAPVDHLTNRFRMSLSFRFPSDGSWIRDYFSYDFRFWTLAEVLEALREVGFEEVRVEVLDRGVGDAGKEEVEELVEGKGRKEGEGEDQEEEEEGNFALLMQTEAEESRPAVTYKLLETGDKVFARRSFGSECRRDDVLRQTRRRACALIIPSAAPLIHYAALLAYIVAKAPP
jgi:hypothetical protein